MSKNNTKINTFINNIKVIFFRYFISKVIFFVWICFLDQWASIERKSQDISCKTHHYHATVWDTLTERTHCIDSQYDGMSSHFIITLFATSHEKQDAHNKRMIYKTRNLSVHSIQGWCSLGRTVVLLLHQQVWQHRRCLDSTTQKTSQAVNVTSHYKRVKQLYLCCKA